MIPSAAALAPAMGSNTMVLVSGLLLITALSQYYNSTIRILFKNFTTLYKPSGCYDLE